MNKKNAVIPTYPIVFPKKIRRKIKSFSYLPTLFDFSMLAETHLFFLGLTCKNEVDQIKNEGARVFTRFLPLKIYGDFPDAQGQLTPNSLVRSGRISNSSEMLCMSSLPASMKKIRSDIEALECSQHYTSIFQTRKGI